MTLSDFFANTYVQTAILSILSAMIAALFATRPRVVWSKAHQSSFRVQPNKEEPPFYVYTSEIWIKNSGRAQAKHLEVVLNYRPQHFEVWTPRKFTEVPLADGRLSLNFATLGPQDEFDISMLQTYAETPLVIEVRHEVGLAKETEMQTTEKPGIVFLLAFLGLSVAGFLLILYQVAAFFGPLLFSGV